MTDDLLQIRSVGVCFYVLRDAAGLYLIDGGFIGGRADLQRALRIRGWNHLPIKGIVATHGHLDHTLNIGRIAAETGAWVAAPRLDALHYGGRATYRGISRVTGFLEAVGRPLLGFRPFAPDRLLDDGDTLDIWRGLTVVHLPGHTDGHSGLLCKDLGLLFCGDLFASHGRFSHFPPAIFNNHGEQIPASAARALDLDLTGIWPAHCDRSPPEKHLVNLQRLHGRHRQP